MINKNFAVITKDRNNTLDILRLMAAVFVILNHSYPLTGNIGILCGVLGGGIAVGTFFTISGYVIAQSWFSDPTPSRFLWKRVLRLVPGLVAVVIFTIFIIGPINTSLSLQEYFFNIHTWMYLLVILLFRPIRTLPGVFILNAYPTAVNGSLWTIPLEFRMYILLCLMGMIGMLKNRKIFLSIVILTCTIYIYSILLPVWPVNILTNAFGYIYINEYILHTVNAGIPLDYPPYNLLFCIGTLFYLYKDQIKFNNGLALVAAIGLLVSSISFSIVSANVSYLLIAILICLPYLVLYLGQLPIKQLYNIGDRYGDYSYGLYIYAFPVQQTIAHFMPKISPIPMFALSLPTTFIFAYSSWWLLEKKALSLKKREPKKIFLDTFTYIKNIT